MPAHIYVQVGRYEDAMRVNATAVQADVTLAGQQAAQGFTVSKDWRGHNQHFLWYAAIMAGREDEAMAAAAGLGEQVKDVKNTFAEYVRSLPLVTLVRFEQWDKVLQQPRPEGERGIAQTWYEYARGVAHARLGRIDEAQASLQRLQAVAPGVRAAYPKDTGQQRRIRAQLDMADAGLQSEIGLARKQYDEAIAQQARMLEAARSADSLEPPLFADGTRVKLGEIQLRAGRFAEAEATFREALKERPGSPWATRGLAKAIGRRV
jgi:tetratricopeptide (TPR) repeat protein